MRLGDAIPSLHARVVAALRQAIVSRHLKPGERLVEERLAETLGVSRVPVREAIRALASEGLVVLEARRGASVARLSPQEARETIELRALLEGQNARLAARRRDPGVRRRIEAVLERGAAAVRDGRTERLAGLNERFHAELASAGENTVLAELLTRLRDRTEMLFAPTHPAHQREAWDDHAAILQSIVDGDEERAAALAAAHVMRAGEALLDGAVSSASAEPAAAAG